MMSRYIDADLLKDEFIGDFTEDYGVLLIKSVIDLQPTADVQEVKHAKWIDKPLSGYSYCRCSNYRKITEIFVSRYGVATQKYCPNCGAKMDLEDK